MNSEAGAITLTDRQFHRISETLYRLCGIHLTQGKEELVKSRLMKRLRSLGLASFNDYIDLVEAHPDGEEFITMVDCLTTNKTSFFRENEHFEFLKRAILPGLATPARFWCAGCSTGEEPYTLSIVLREGLPDIDARDVKILATDISTRVLARARAGVYARDTLADVPGALLQRYFTGDGGRPPQYQAGPDLKRLIRFARLNLMETWPMQGPFAVIFCRNVMIYFDKPTQERLIRRFAELLAPGGHLFVGHSESLAGMVHGLGYVQPATYRKE